MARTRTPGGKRKVIPVRVSEPKFAAIEAARGETPRSVWVEAAIDAYLSPPGRELAARPVTVYVNAAPAETASETTESVYGNDESGGSDYTYEPFEADP